MEGVIYQIIACLGMDEDVESISIEHQPRDNLRELVRSERNLIHRFRMWAHKLLVPTPELHLEPGAKGLPYACSPFTRFRIEVNMRVITGDVAHVLFHCRIAGLHSFIGTYPV